MKYALIALAGPFLLAACSAEPSPDPEPTQEATATSQPMPSIASPEPVEPQSPATGTRTITATGLGALAIGEPPARPWAEDDVRLSESCRTYHADEIDSVYAMSDGKAVRRISASKGSGVVTDRGVAPGDSEAKVREAYSGIKAEPHKYVEAPAKYLTWMPEGADGPGLRFEIDDDGRVSIIHAGSMPWLAYVEGCA